VSLGGGGGASASQGARLGCGALRELVFELEDALLLRPDDALEVFVLLDDRAAVVAG
jgi:hypothetical protein